MEGMIGEIRLFAGNFAPRSWSLCQGQLLAISSNSALFSILGTVYGGDGRSTFALPDLRGRAAVGQGNGPGLSDYRLGAKGGVETVTLVTSQIPSHSHTATLHSELSLATTGDPTNRMLAGPPAAAPIYADAIAADNVSMHPDSIVGGNTGGGQAHENRAPFLALNYIICLFGVFPSRS